MAYLEELLPEFRKDLDNCRPARRDEVTFYEEKKDDKYR